MEIILDLEKTYEIPENIKEIYFQNKYIIISVDKANWIVLDNDKQKKIFNKLLNEKIENVYKFAIENNIQEEFIKVVTEIEAKNFTNKEISKIKLDGLCIYLTNKCNLRCKHCYMYSGIENKQELTLNEIKKIIKNFKLSGGTKVTFTGGEVAERLDLIEILKFTKESDLKITVLSNGTKWTKEMISNAVDFIDEIQISVDGYDDESNGRVRGNGNFDLAMGTINNFLKHHIKVSIAITPIYDNLENEKNNYIKFAKELIEKNLDKDFHIKFNYELLEGREIKVTENKNFNYSKVMHEIVESCYENNELVEFIINNQENIILNNCGYGGITIASNGNIYFCNRIYEINSYGNIREKSFSDILKISEKIAEQSNINNLRPCNQCHLKYICGGGCRIKHFPELVRLNDVNKKIRIKERQCSNEIKERYYKLMIESNEYLYK